MRIWGSPEFADEDRWRADAERAFDRCFDPSGTRRQFLAIVASPSRAEVLREVDLPVLVIHGDRDTLIDIWGGRRTAELIPAPGSKRSRAWGRLPAAAVEPSGRVGRGVQRSPGTVSLDATGAPTEVGAPVTHDSQV